MEKISITKFTVVGVNIVIAHLKMCKENLRLRRVRIRAIHMKKNSNILEVTGRNTLSGVFVTGHFDKDGPSWICYP